MVRGLNREEKRDTEGVGIYIEGYIYAKGTTREREKGQKKETYIE